MSDTEPGVEVYVKVSVLGEPERVTDGYYHIPVAIEHTGGLPLPYVVALLQRAADILSGGEIDE